MPATFQSEDGVDAETSAPRVELRNQSANEIPEDNFQELLKSIKTENKKLLLSIQNENRKLGIIISQGIGVLENNFRAIRDALEMFRVPLIHIL
ncbi:hypothetical protein TWF481_002590 [Arthrobotrys musiformis]|uniref:Uncharacterized protein n=1 Tax=Arthrobotrys musiformis TaxID=47236 RepID=A0AAV9VQN0_9PEZI